MVPHDECSNHDKVAPDHAGFQQAGPPSSAAAGNHLQEGGRGWDDLGE